VDLEIENCFHVERQISVIIAVDRKKSNAADKCSHKVPRDIPDLSTKYQSTDSTKHFTKFPSIYFSKSKVCSDLNDKLLHTSR
jgi:hypothetical protein